MTATRAIWFLPLCLLLLGAALLGWRQGWRAANVTAGEVVAAYAARYVAERRAAGTGADAGPADCRATAAAAQGQWLVVVCGPVPYDPARHYTYHVNRFGGLVRRVGPSRPET
ncbi:hypothetical protein [Roseivivax sp. CAU 1761]